MKVRVEESDLEEILYLLDELLSGQFRKGSRLDGYGHEYCDLVELGKKVARLGDAIGVDTGWTLDDLSWWEGRHET